MGQRLIDADALIPMMKYATTDSEIGVFPIKIGFNAITEVINNAPTIDAEPVRHGKWIDETFKPWGLVHHPFKCNLCGEHAEFASPYCPQCGSRMDKE